MPDCIARRSPIPTHTPLREKNYLPLFAPTLRAVASAVAALALVLATSPHEARAQRTVITYPAHERANIPLQRETQHETLRDGFSVQRLDRITRFLDDNVTQGHIMGAVGYVLRDGKVVYEHATGWADRDAKRAMTADAIFRIASQTKALTSTAILMLVEEGRIALGDPVSRYIPEFAHTTVAMRSDTGRTVVPAKRQITIKDLLTHTAGISYGTDAFVAQRYAAKGLGPAAGWGWYTADKDEPVCTTMARLASLPFVAQPGEQWVYGYNTDILGCVVEKASGLPLDEFIRTRITAPLGLRDTRFFVPQAERDRLVTVYMSDSTDHVSRAPDGPRGQGNYVDGPRRNFSGGAGLTSTAHDYAHFLEMLRHDGTLDGTRFLSPKSVELMRTNQSGTLYGQPGQGFGLAFETTEKYGAHGLASVGSYGWGGAYGSTYKVDPAEGLVIIFMINQVPNRSDVPAKFQTLVYQALVDARSTAVVQR